MELFLIVHYIRAEAKRMKNRNSDISSRTLYVDMFPILTYEYSKFSSGLLFFSPHDLPSIEFH
ncbi:CLUMA_CG008337, isoform A [Clunio marinus]|uniref:CLUMA_CG008337, isoform A n=1 Tax=Clunio marinus TaxID=568069 RepID=A0A1J1I3H3_9DIPT|nr:CLUMA_CG008337, isoform A [Clunio marinus]